MTFNCRMSAPIVSGARSTRRRAESPYRRSGKTKTALAFDPSSATRRKTASDTCAPVGSE
ncbi:unannotated protein [freshwater metagenome]|uniref:Unannotated protein n=1 Tax=freshwater metagenome TaxID=449393 RepID=A0A6J6HMF4_9ZZZZ